MYRAPSCVPCAAEDLKWEEINLEHEIKVLETRLQLAAVKRSIEYLEKGRDDVIVVQRPMDVLTEAAFRAMPNNDASLCTLDNDKLEVVQEVEENHDEQADEAEEEEEENDSDDDKQEGGRRPCLAGRTDLWTDKERQIVLAVMHNALAANPNKLYAARKASKALKGARTPDACRKMYRSATSNEDEDEDEEEDTDDEGNESASHKPWSDKDKATLRDCLNGLHDEDDDDQPLDGFERAALLLHRSAKACKDEHRRLLKVSPGWGASVGAEARAPKPKASPATSVRAPAKLDVGELWVADPSLMVSFLGARTVTLREAKQGAALSEQARTRFYTALAIITRRVNRDNTPRTLTTDTICAQLTGKNTRFAQLGLSLASAVEGRVARQPQALFTPELDSNDAMRAIASFLDGAYTALGCNFDALPPDAVASFAKDLLDLKLSAVSAAMQRAKADLTSIIAILSRK